MTPNQLPPLPEPDSYQFQHDETGQTMFVDRQQVEWGFEANNPRLHKIGGAFAADQMHAYALAALAQQEPVAWLYVDTVGERYLCFSRPTGGGTITNLYTPPPAPQPAPVDELPDLNPEDVAVDVVLKQLGGFAPVTTHGVRVTHKPSRVSVVVDSERSQHRNRQLALEALRATIHHQANPVPAPVDELIEALEDLMDWQVKNVKSWHNRAYDRAHFVIEKHRAARQSPAPQTKGQP